MAVSVDQGFEETSENGGTTTRLAIHGSGIGPGAWFGFGFFGLIMGGLVSLIMLAETVMPFLVVFLGCLGIAALLQKFRTERFEFEISETLIRTADNREYLKTDISELLIQNKSGQNIQSANTEGTTLVFGTGVTGAAFVGAQVLGNSAKKLGAASGEAIQESMAKRGFSLCIRHGRKVIPLAKYLTEDDAVALFNKVAQHY